MTDGEVRPWMAFATFAVFGAFWGTWGASIPAIRGQAHVTDGQLGVALLFIGTGALPAMPLSGRAVDRWGLRATAALLALLGGAGLLAALTARGFVALALGLTALGASSGAADVAINTVAGSAQRATDRPVVPRAHATFSAAVVAASLLVGVLDGLDAPIVTPFVVVAGAAVAVATSLARAALEPERRQALGVGANPRATPPEVDGPCATPPRPQRPPIRLAPLLVLGGLGALAYTVENAHQSWSALYLHDELGASPALAATGPAVFAGVVAGTRFASATVAAHRPAIVVVAGSALAAAGTTIVAGAGSVPIGLTGIALAAAGIAALFPTLMSVMTERTPGERRGVATSVVTTVAYLGFIAGPAYVGTCAGFVGLPGAMLAVAGLAIALAVLAATALRGISPPVRSRSSG